MAYELPTRKNHPVVKLSAKGLEVKGEVIDYRAIAQVVCSDDEVEFVFRQEIPTEYATLAQTRPAAFSLEHANRKPLTVLVDPESSHQLPDMQKFIEAFMSQNGRAEWDAARETIVNMPSFDCSRIKNDLINSFSVGV